MLLLSLVFSSLPCILSLLTVLYSVLYLYEVLMAYYVAILAFGWRACLLAGVFVVLFQFCLVSCVRGTSDFRVCEFMKINSYTGNHLRTVKGGLLFLRVPKHNTSI